ncbi:MAG: hypothetical protein ACRBCT_08490 [Alphaproteobacteria bacterium]
MIRCFLCFVCLSCFALPALAQGGSAPRTAKHPNEASAYRANPRYNHMVRQAEAERSPYFDFTYFRRYYTQTRQFDPLGDRAMESLLRLSYEAENAQNEEESIRAFAAFRVLAKDHLANLRIVLYALSLSRSDKRYGDPALYAWVRDGLIEDVIVSGNGESLQQAYDVITPAEETALFSRLGVTPVKTENKIAGSHRYNVHVVRDEKTGTRRRLFIDTTFPVKFLEKQQKSIFSLGVNKQ